MEKTQDMQNYFMIGRIFQRKIGVGRAASTIRLIRLKFWLKFLFSDNNSDVLNGIDWYLEH